MLKFCERICPGVVRKSGKKANGSIPLSRGVGDSLTPTPVLKALEIEPTEERVKLEASALAEAKGRLEDEVRKVNELLKTREKEVAHRDATIQRLEREKSEAQIKLVESRTAVARVQELSARLSEKDKLLSERTAELSAAQAFLTRVDAVSEAEVVGMVENLNTLISSTSGALSDTWDQRAPVPGALIEEPGAGQIRDYFSNLVFEQITLRNPVAVTLAVEMHLVQFVERVISGWGGGDGAGTMGEIYGRIFTEEGQTIASRWRTLTKRYAPRQELPQDEELIDDLAAILVITGSFSDFPDAVESVRTSARAEVNAIIEATLHLDDVIKTKISSSDMFVYVVTPGTTFTEETMLDEFWKVGTIEKGGERKIVAGTMEIGLLQRVGNVEKVLRKPKVILERDLPEPEGEGKK